MSPESPVSTGTTTWLAVTPLDTIMVRDGRPFDAGGAGSATAVPPAPNTLGGVVWAALGRNVDRILGPVVETAGGVVFPAPRDVVRGEDRTSRRLAVAERADTAVSDLDEHYRLSHHLVGEGDPTSEWITWAGLVDWLTGAMPGGQAIAEPSPLRKDPAWVPEARLGLARHWSGPLTGTAAPGLLYAMTQLRPREDTRFLVGCVADKPIEKIYDTLVPLGGRGRLAEVTITAADPLPDRPQDFPDGRLAVYLVTPALLQERFWSPPQAELVAVAVTGPQPVAGASPRNGFADSRQLLWTVPAGSVFFLKFATSAAATSWAVEHHGGLLPHQSLDVRSQPELPLVHAGFGTCLTGRW